MRFCFVCSSFSSQERASGDLQSCDASGSTSIGAVAALRAMAKEKKVLLGQRAAVASKKSVACVESGMPTIEDKKIEERSAHTCFATPRR